MGIRDRIKSKLKDAAAKFSGEYSEPAPKAEEIKRFDRNLGENPDAKIVRAKLERPREKNAKD
jgi:hypothetical protein